MILPTSTPPIEGDSGSRTNEGVKNILIYLKANPVGISTTLTTTAVFLCPSIKSQSSRAKNRMIMHATEAGKATELKLMR